MRSVLRTAVIVLAVLGGLAVVQMLAGADRPAPQIVYVTAPAPTPAPAPQIIIRHEVVRVQAEPPPEQPPAPESVEYAPSQQQVYSAPMEQPMVIQRESPHQTRNMIVGFTLGVVTGAIVERVTQRRASYNQYGWGGGQGGNIRRTQVVRITQTPNRGRRR